MNLKDYLAKKKNVETLRKQADQAEGAYQQLLLQLKEYGCENYQQAKEKLHELTKLYKELESVHWQEWQEYEKAVR